MRSDFGHGHPRYPAWKGDSSERYDACRIIFTILDNRKDLSLKDINEILSATGEFSPKEIENLEKTEFNMQLCEKVITFMGGHLKIKSSST